MDEFTPHDLTVLADYFGGAASKTEKARIKQWIAESPDRDRFITILNESRINYSPSMAETVADLPAHLETLSVELSKAIKAQDKQHRHSPAVTRPINSVQSVPSGSHQNATPGKRWKWVQHPLSAAVLAIAATLLVGLGWNMSDFGRDVTSAHSISTYSTNNGERATVTLADGSTILLNVGSHVEVPSNYGAGNRTITLRGQAYFTVVPNAKAPFIVRSGMSVTRVLGTRFSVRNYSADSVALVAVDDGKVAVGNTIVTSAQQVTVSRSGVSAVQTAERSSTSFVHGILTLTKMPLPAAILELNRWYNVDIRLGDPSLEPREVDGGFVIGSVSDLQSILELMYDVRVVRSNRMLTLYPRG